MKKKIAITFPTVPFFSGGAELHVEQLKQNLRRRGYDAEIVSIPHKWYPVPEIWNQMMLWKSIDLSETNGEKIDLVIGTKWPSYLARHENKIIWLIHQYREAYDLRDETWSQFHETGPARPYLEEFVRVDTAAFHEAKKIFTISKNVSSRLQKFNGVDSEPLYHPPKFYGSYYCSEKIDNYILSVGRLDRLKRLDLLIQAMKYTDRNIKCLIAGTGAAVVKDELEKLVEENDLQDRVIFLGFISDEEMLRLYAGALAVFFAPHDEDYGYITLEAFLSHKPLVTTWDAGGVLEFAEHKINAMISDPTPAEIGKSIDYLYSHPKDARDFGELGYLKVKDITWDNALDRLLSFSGLE